MYTLLFFFAIFCALAYAFYSTFIKSHSNYEQQKTVEQPTHFDLLDDNGDRLGYVPKDMTKVVRNFTILPCKCYCYIGENNGVYYSYCYIPQN